MDETKAITAAAIRKLGGAYQLAIRLQLTSQTVDDWRTGKQVAQAHHLLMRKILQES